MRKMKFVSMFVLLALLLSVGPGAVMAQEPLPPSNVDQISQNDIEAVLSDYSRALFTGRVTQHAYYTPTMEDFVQERGSFYEELFDVGLHSTLDSVESEFVFESGRSDVEVSKLSNDHLSVKVAEIVTLHGMYNSSPEKSPLVRAGRWALSQTDNEAVKRALEQYIQSVVEDVSKSSKEGFEIEFVVRHELVITNGTDGPQIVQDSFTDQDNVNPSGTDKVSWIDGRYVRNKPDLTGMPDYVIHVTPMEQLGEGLLSYYTGIYGERAPLGHSYYRDLATSYINRWTSNTDKLPCGDDTRSDPSYYNPSYTYFACNDCTNYASQALSAGGISLTDEWHPYTGAWIYPGQLWWWMINNGRGQEVGSVLYLQKGDLGFKGDLTHAVMVASTSPLRYSAHTSDRKQYSWQSSLTKLIHVYSWQP